MNFKLVLRPTNLNSVEFVLQASGSLSTGWYCPLASRSGQLRYMTGPAQWNPFQLLTSADCPVWLVPIALPGVERNNLHAKAGTAWFSPCRIWPTSLGIFKDSHKCCNFNPCFSAKVFVYCESSELGSQTLLRPAKRDERTRSQAAQTAWHSQPLLWPCSELRAPEATDKHKHSSETANSKPHKPKKNHTKGH